MILFRKARRRTPGVYLYRTRRHLRRGTEWGYVGKSNHLARRRDCHEGHCTRHPECAGGKPWADLIVSYRRIRLPWWLGWQPVTLSLETIVTALLRPRYNWQKNPRRSKVPPRIQKIQRAARDRARSFGFEPARRLRAGWLAPALGVAMIVIALTGYLINR